MAFNKQFDIAGTKVGIGCEPYLIAEIGRNHNADMDLAKKMIDAAVEAGASAVKFQSFTAEGLLIKKAPKLSHVEETSEKTQSAYEATKQVELTLDNHRELSKYAKSRGVPFLSTPEEHAMVDLLEDLGVPAFKIASLDVTYLDLVKRIAKTGKPIILSTGMSYLGEIETALLLLETEGVENMVLLHCSSLYPPPYEEVNLKAMVTLANAFDVPVGYSDHTPGIGVSIAAVALGACVIERHFTLDKNLPGPDQRLSLTPEEFAQLAAELRAVHSALGVQRKAPSHSEHEMRRLLRRRLVSTQALSAGTRLEQSHLTCKCSELGLEPKLLDFLVGRILRIDVDKDTPITFEHV